MMEEYEIQEIATLPSDRYPYIFQFWPENAGDHPYINFMAVIHNWCMDNFGRYGWYVSKNSVFLDEEYALAFKLRWME